MTSPKRLVLIVDDEYEIAETLAALLEHCGYQTLKAYDGQNALALYRAHSRDISLVLCDVTMPVMNGLEFFRAGLHEFGTLPLVMITAHSEVARVSEAIRLGALDYLVKPYQSDMIVERLPQWLEIGRKQAIQRDRR